MAFPGGMSPAFVAGMPGVDILAPARLQHHSIEALPALVAPQQRILRRTGLRGANCKVQRHAWPFSKPPPPPPWWRQPKTWIAAGAGVLLVAIVALVVRARRRARDTARLPKMSLGEMYYRLEKVAGTPGLSEEPEAAAPKSAPTLTPLPPAPKTTAPLPPPVAMPPTSSSTEAPLPSPTSTSDAPPPTTAPTTMPPPAATTPAEPVKQEKKKSKIGSFLSGGSKKASVPTLSELVVGEDESPRTRFIRAIASQLRLEVPEDMFTSVEGLQNIPSTVPLATRTMLLQQAVNAEAEKFKPVERAEIVVEVAKSMVVDLVDAAEGKKDAKERSKALSEVGVFVWAAEHMCKELSPDVEASKVTYEGTLRYKKLEDLFGEYLEASLGDLNELVVSMTTGNLGSQEQQESLQKKAAQQELLGSLFKISEGRMTKMAEKVMEKNFAGLGNLGGLGKM